MDKNRQWMKLNVKESKQKGRNLQKSAINIKRKDIKGGRANVWVDWDQLEVIYSGTAPDTYEYNRSSTRTAWLKVSKAAKGVKIKAMIPPPSKVAQFLQDLWFRISIWAEHCVELVETVLC